MDTQRIIGADIIMALDECTPYPCPYDYAQRSMHLTHRWLERCIDHFNKTSPLYGHEQQFFHILPASNYNDQRAQSAERVAAFHLPGNAMGGLAVDRTREVKRQRG